MDEKQRYDEGLNVRRAVLGDAHVDRSLNALTEFNSEFQEMITRHAWGDIWTRPGLPRHTRSLITIAMLIGMNRNEELKLHLCLPAGRRFLNCVPPKQSITPCNINHTEPPHVIKKQEFCSRHVMRDDACGRPIIAR